MRFRPIRIIVCLVIGAAMTVGVAWVCAWVLGGRNTTWSRWVGTDSTPAPASWPYWSIEGEDEFVRAWLAEPREYAEYACKRELIITRWSVGVGNDKSSLHQEVCGFGFPLPALWYGYWFREETFVDMGRQDFPANGLHGGYHSTFGLKNGLPSNLYLSGFRYPVLPLYFGFTVNTLFYAAITYALWSLCATAIAWRRLSHGKCPNCNYPLGPSPVCTECGTKIPGRPDAAAAVPITKQPNGQPAK